MDIKITDIESSQFLDLFLKYLKSNKYLKFNDDEYKIIIKGFKNLDIIKSYNKRDYFLMKGFLENVKTKRH